MPAAAWPAAAVAAWVPWQPWPCLQTYMKLTQTAAASQQHCLPQLPQLLLTSFSRSWRWPCWQWPEPCWIWLIVGGWVTSIRDPPRLSCASGISSGLGSSIREAGVEAGLSSSGHLLQETTSSGRFSYPGSQPLTPLQGSALNTLRCIVASAQPTYIMGLQHQGSEGCGASPHSCADGPTTDGVFAVELGLGRDTTSVDEGQSLSPAPATPTAGAGATGRLPADVIGNLLGAVASVGLGLGSPVLCL